MALIAEYGDIEGQRRSQRQILATKVGKFNREYVLYFVKWSEV